MSDLKTSLNTRRKTCFSKLFLESVRPHTRPKSYEFVSRIDPGNAVVCFPREFSVKHKATVDPD